MIYKMRSSSGRVHRFNLQVVNPSLPPFPSPSKHTVHPQPPIFHPNSLLQLHSQSDASTNHYQVRYLLHSTWIHVHTRNTLNFRTTRHATTPPPCAQTFRPRRCVTYRPTDLPTNQRLAVELGPCTMQVLPTYLHTCITARPSSNDTVLHSTGHSSPKTPSPCTVA